MNAPMLGMTMFDRNVPNFWTLTRTPVRGASVLVDMCTPSGLSGLAAFRNRALVTPVTGFDP